ncbi:MAG TPA: YciI-like protein [bacterium]
MRGIKNRQFYALIYYVVNDYVSRRAKYRDEHFKFARAAQRRGELIMGGAFADPVERALLIFHVTARSVVENFAKHDPYVIHGLVTRWEICPWTVVIGPEKFNPSSDKQSVPNQ